MEQALFQAAKQTSLVTLYVALQVIHLSFIQLTRMSDMFCLIKKFNSEKTVLKRDEDVLSLIYTDKI